MKLHRLLSIAALILLGALPAFAAESLFAANEARPADAVVLFDGKDLANWVYVDSGKPAEWKVENGYMEVKGGNIRSKQEFGDHQLHVEFCLPRMDGASGQGRANSGVYVHGSYEIQVLDSYGLAPGGGDCGAIYGVGPPMTNACRPPEHWQSYDIFFRAPRFDEKGNKTSNARMSVMQNGVWIHVNVEVPGPTAASMSRDVKAPGPVMLQDHGSPVRFRNVWVRPL